MKNIFLVLILLAVISLNSSLFAEVESNSKLFLGVNVGNNLMEFHSFDDWNNWRPDFEYKKTLALRIEYSFKTNPNLILFSNTSLFDRSINLPLSAFPLFPPSPTKFQQRSSEKSSFLLNEFGIKYNIKLFKGLSIFPKLGFYYAYRFDEQYKVNEEEFKYEEDDIKNNQIGYNVGGGVSYSIHNIKMILEYNYLDGFSSDNPKATEAYIFWNHIHSLNFILGYEFNLGGK